MAIGLDIVYPESYNLVAHGTSIEYNFKQYLLQGMLTRHIQHRGRARLRWGCKAVLDEGLMLLATRLQAIQESVPTDEFCGSTTHTGPNGIPPIKVV
jgi:hypothetical protein